MLVTPIGKITSWILPDTAAYGSVVLNGKEIFASVVKRQPSDKPVCARVVSSRSQPSTENHIVF